jgi:hypothetical protein
MAIGTTLKIGFDGSEVQRGFAQMKAGVLNIGGSIAGMGIATITTAIAAAGAAMVAFGVSSSKAAMDTESLTTQFKTLLGSKELATKRMAEITKFAAETPFEISELAKTSKLLQTMGGDLLATGAGLTMVGDAAAVAGQPIEEVGLHIGRVFNAITSGTSAGESVARLQELGLISGTVKREFESLAEAQKKGEVATLSSEAALLKLQSVLSGTAGGMKNLSETTAGRLSNMKDQFSQLQVAFGTGLNEGLGVVYEQLGGVMGKFTEAFTLAGKAIGGAIADAVEGDSTRLEAIGAYIGTLLKDGITSALQAAGENIAIQIAKDIEKFSGIGAIRGAIGKESLTETIKSGQKNFSGYWAENKSQREGLLTGIKSSVAVDDSKKIYAESQAEIVAAATKRIQEIKADPFAVADADKEIAKILKEIEKNTSEGAKM